MWVVSVITAGDGLSVLRVAGLGDEMLGDGQFLSEKRVERCQFLTVTYVGVGSGGRQRLPQERLSPQ